MKLLFTLFLSGIVQFSIATTYYISPNGNDQTGNGSINNPWHSLYQATAAVKTAGDIIHVVAGTYTETIRSTLFVGVSIEGEGASSVIQSTLSEQFVAIIVASSPEGTNGNQHISNIKLDGNNRTTSWAIEIRGRSNFAIHDCTIIDFDETGVQWCGRSDNNNEAPAIYATGNSFYNNTLSNCAKYEGFGWGCLGIGGQDGMLIYNNKISQTGRAKGTNGWPIKYANDGFLKGCKIYNNTIVKQAFDGITWDFAIELFNVSGLEIYNNTIAGSVDLNYQSKGNYPYSVYIHDNTIGPYAMQHNLENGIVLEYSTETAVIEKNHFKNLGVVIYFTPRAGSLISDISIRDNLCDNIGVADKSHQGFAIRFGAVDLNSYAIQDFFVENNKFLANPEQAPYWGIGFLDAAKANNIQIRNNTISNFSAAGITADPASIIDTIVIENNILTGNGFANKPAYVQGQPQHIFYKNNTASGGTIFTFTNLKMNIIRPVYKSLKNTSVLELLAVFALILSLLFSYKENSYVFPLVLIATLAYIFLTVDQGFYGNALLAVYFVAMGVYGWRVWLKRNHRKHRIVRITASTKKEIQIQLACFAIFFAILFAALNYFKKSFAPGIIAWADALVYAAAFTGMWLFTQKKVEAWYWLIAASAASIFLFFTKHYILISMYYVPILAIAVLTLYRWKRKRRVKKRI